jgi:predicted transcriptional regulator of viral defense system
MIGKNELQIIAKLSYYGKDIVSFDELKKYMPNGYKYMKQAIYNLKKKNILTSIKRGIYSFNPVWSLPTGRQINSLKIGNAFFSNKDYYIGCYNMFNFYGLTEQMSKTTFIINKKISATKIINGLEFKFVKLKEEFFYGITEIEIDGEKIKASDKERTMLDFINYWNFNEAKTKIVEIIKSASCDIKKFINYSVRFPKIKVRKYAGMFLDEAGITAELTDSLYSSVNNSALISTSSFSRQGKKNKKWGVIINELK